jgi:hypothetical protein
MTTNSAIDSVAKDQEAFEYATGKFQETLTFSVVLIGEVITTPMN